MHTCGHTPRGENLGTSEGVMGREEMRDSTEETTEAEDKMIVEKPQVIFTIIFIILEKSLRVWRGGICLYLSTWRLRQIMCLRPTQGQSGIHEQWGKLSTNPMHFVNK